MLLYYKGHQIQLKKAAITLGPVKVKSKHIYINCKNPPSPSFFKWFTS